MNRAELDRFSAIRLIMLVYFKLIFNFFYFTSLKRPIRDFWHYFTVLLVYDITIFVRSHFHKPTFHFVPFYYICICLNEFTFFLLNYYLECFCVFVDFINTESMLGMSDFEYDYICVCVCCQFFVLVI